jgi:hypothetical protein
MFLPRAQGQFIGHIRNNRPKSSPNTTRAGMCPLQYGKMKEGITFLLGLMCFEEIRRFPVPLNG